MAKTKKAPAKAAKKPAKAKPAAKVKKAASTKTASKSKKAVVKKAKPTSKPTAKKATSKAAPKAVAKAAPKTKAKVAPKKPVAKKESAKKTAPAVTKKAVTDVRDKAKTPAANAAKIAATAQLNFFQMPNQRPMAHKPAKPSTNSDEKTRYSEEELKEFEVLINRKLEKAREEYKILKETLNRNNDEGTDATSGGNTKVLEDGAETAEKENLSQLAARQQKYITNLENALVRIKNGTYGICSVTGKLIAKERLIAVPHTTQSIEAKLMQQD